ncbi:MAG: thioesterase family protein [Clostridia bacterium]|nr:thioesterase family protein [Clostridia bacterium]
MLETGIKYSKETVCDENNTAAAVGSGSLRVFSTPALLTLMELCCAEAVLPFLEEGQSTVGTSVSLKHVAATPVGMKITAECVLREVDRRRLVFTVKAYDQTELVGECEHERFIVNNDKFLDKCYSKAE